MSNTKSRQTVSESYKANRAKLRELSALAKQLVEAGEAGSINEALLMFYRQDGHEEFKTFNQWKKEGMSINKGSKAFLIWASPKQIPNPDKESEKDKMRYFPICYLFSNKQVSERRAS